jgi:hypothetical protein
MANPDFSYEINSTDANKVIVAKVRMEIGDSDPERGIKPNADNYTDSEILSIYDDEDQEIGRTAARIAEQMALAWSSVPRTMHGSLFDPRHIRRNFDEMSRRLRRQYGYTSEISSSFSIPVKRA